MRLFTSFDVLQTVFKTMTKSEEIVFVSLLLLLQTHVPVAGMTFNLAHKTLKANYQSYC